MTTVVSEKRGTETLVCDGCRKPVGDGEPLPVTLLSPGCGTLTFHRMSCLTVWVLRFVA